MVAQRGAVSAPPVGRAGRVAAVEVNDVAMTERGEVLHGQPDASVVGGAHHLDGRGADPSGHHQDGELAGELGEPGRGSLGSEQQQCLAAVVQQGLDRAVLTPARRQGAERDVIAGGFGGQVDALEQVGVERVLGPERHAEQPAPAAAARQQPGPRIGPVPDLGGGLQYPGSGGLAGSGRAADDDRHQCARDPGPGGHVLERGPSSHRSSEIF